jgi:hypothetical protein
MEGGKAESGEVRYKNKRSNKFDEKHAENRPILRFDSAVVHRYGNSQSRPCRESTDTSFVQIHRRQEDYSGQFKISKKK